MKKWSREEKMAYYFWLDEVVLQHWSEYLDLKLEYTATNEPECEKKLQLIDYYQSILDDVGKEFSWEELNEWYCNKYGKGAAFVRFCKDWFHF